MSLAANVATVKRVLAELTDLRRQLHGAPLVPFFFNFLS